MKPMNKWQRWKIAKKRRKIAKNQLQAKRIKCTLLDEEQIVGITFSDIHYDCLETVFEKLTIKDLLNLADTSNTLRTLIKSRLISKFKQLKRIEIENVHPGRMPSIRFDGFCCRINDAKSSLQFLRCFGHLIQTIYIDYDADFGFLYTRIYRYLNEYCCDTLKRLRIASASTFAFNCVLDKPFSKVKQVILDDIILGDTFSHFNQLFPNVHSLKMNNVRLINEQCIEQYFPHMHKLALEQHDTKKYSRPDRRLLLRESNFAAILRLNPSITKLVVGGFIFDAIFRQHMSDSLHAIKQLTVTSDGTTFRLKNDVIYFANVEIFYMYICTNKRKKLPTIPFAFGKLKKIDLWLDAAYLGRKFIHFVRIHPLLIDLTISSKSTQFSNNPGHIQQLVEALPSLRRLYIMEYGFSFDEVITLIKGCKQLKEVHLGKNIFTSNTMLMEHIGNQWRITKFHEDSVLLQRFSFSIVE